MARKPGKRVLPLGVDACRVGASKPAWKITPGRAKHTGMEGYGEREGRTGPKETDSRCDGNTGRYPANVLHDGSDEVLEAFAAFGEKTKGGAGARPSDFGGRTTGRFRAQPGESWGIAGDTGTAARFFYAAKASKAERGKDNAHPTVKPLALMRWMVRLVTPEGGRVLDPFAGSGSTLVAAAMEGREAVGIELDPAHCETARRRVQEALGLGRGSLLAALPKRASLFEE